MAHVLITGGAGFIGSHIADLLVDHGHCVRIIDLLDPQIHGNGKGFPRYSNPAVECMQGDVRNPADIRKALQGIDVVYHCASFTGVGQSMYQMRSYLDTNSTGTATLLEAIVTQSLPIKRFVLASSRAVYGEGTHHCLTHGILYPGMRNRCDMERGRFEVYCPSCGQALEALPTEEERPLTPFSLYGWTKKHQEDLCLYAADIFGLPVTILRFFNVYGSRQSLKNPYTGILSVFHSRISAGHPVSIYERGIPGRDFIHVSDVARANLLALEKNVAPGTCINIGTGKMVSVREIAVLLGERLGTSPEIIDTDEFRVGDVCRCYADLARAKSLLGFHSHIDLEQGIDEFVGWALREETEDLYLKAVEELKSHGLFGRVKCGETA
ncbi:MAG: NAD-dependent epimerase/dehydratase family protein [Geobacteraceae bacterium]|nr:NAD-dependent epimerase/dehydratase family protein [Geobacteraceae bacterium]